jgi:MFS family permease
MKPQRRAWAVMLAAFLASIVVAINQFKVPPVMQALMAHFGADMATAGWLASATGVVGLVLAIPSAFILLRLGLRATGIVALACTVVGSAIGGLAQSTGVMLAGRLIEGGGYALIAVAAPAAISAWFEPKERGLPMGIWASWVPVGNVIMFNLAYPLLNAFGWQGIWWFGALAGAVALVVYGLVVSEPPAEAKPEPVSLGRAGRLMLNPTAWLLGLALATFGFSLLGYNTWAPTYLTEALHIDAGPASSYASLMFLAAIPANVAAGWLLGRVRNRAAVLPLAFAATTPLYLWSFNLAAAGTVAPFMVALGFVSNFIPTVTYALAPETMPGPQFAGLALAILNAGTGPGPLIAPPLIGAVVSGGHWPAGSLWLAAVMGLGTVAALAVWRRLGAAEPVRARA